MYKASLYFESTLVKCTGAGLSLCPQYPVPAHSWFIKGITKNSSVQHIFHNIEPTNWNKISRKPSQ